MKFKIAIFSLMIFFIGCSTSSKSTKNVYPNTIDIKQQLVASAESIDESLNMLAATEYATHNPNILNTAPLLTPEGGMGILMSLDWQGPVEPLVKQIASQSNYYFKIIGKTPPIPVIVTIHKRDALLADILRDTSYQINKSADIVVYPEQKVIELRYRAA